MKFTKENLNLEQGLTKEWIITNGIGGFASSSILGINTRKYHGLLIASMTPPARRYLILSKVDESITIDGKTTPIFSNMGMSYITKGYEHQVSFEKNELPVFTYEVQGMTITKTICLAYGKNTVGILYQIKNGKKQARLTLAPVINFRDFHSMNTNHQFSLREQIKGNKVRIVVDDKREFPIYIRASEGMYIEHHDDVFRSMFYVEEQKRGFYPEENHAVPGRYEIEIAPNETKEISFICSLEENIDEIRVDELIVNEKKRLTQNLVNTGLIDLNVLINDKVKQLEEIVDFESKTEFTTEISKDKTNQEEQGNQQGEQQENDNKNEQEKELIVNEQKKEQKQKQEQEQQKKQDLIKHLIYAADSFIVYRPSFSLHTIIAGYPWFLDWGRDSLISFEGLLLKTKRYDIAKEVLQTMIRDIKYGLVPNGYSGFDNRPLYNSVDASLLLIEQVQKYLDYTGDEEFVKEVMYPKLELIIENYSKGIDVDDNNIYLDSDYLLVSGTEDTQNTWMDAKVGNVAITPRNGKAVEINSMWYNGLCIMAKLATKMGKRAKAKEYKEMANNGKLAFQERFYNARRKSLYDVLGDSKIRPNQLFALSLSHPIIEPNSEIAEAILSTVEKKLITPYGLKTLAKGEKDYVEIYEGDPEHRDRSYHQGITWPWLLGLYYNALKNEQKAAKTKKRKEEISQKIERLKEETVETFSKEVSQRGCIGSIAEIYDSAKPYEPKGTISQAWSVAEILRIITEE